MLYYGGSKFAELQGKLIVGLHGHRPTGSRVILYDVPTDLYLNGKWGCERLLCRAEQSRCFVNLPSRASLPPPRSHRKRRFKVGKSRQPANRHRRAGRRCEGQFVVVNFGKPGAIGKLAKGASQSELLAVCPKAASLKMPTKLAFGCNDGKTVFATQRQGEFVESFRVERPGREFCPLACLAAK